MNLKTGWISGVALLAIAATVGANQEPHGDSQRHLAGRSALTGHRGSGVCVCGGSVVHRPVTFVSGLYREFVTVRLWTQSGGAAA